jgi:uncharacterized protein YegL
MEKKYCKLYCSIKKLYALATIENRQGKELITNFQPIDNKTASEIDNQGINSLPLVNSNLLESEDNGKRIPLSIDRSKKCNLLKDELRYQCIYCNKLNISKSISNSFSIYFLLDNSGSMSKNDRHEGELAVRKLISTLKEMDNDYSFIPWGSDAGYLFQRTKNISEIEKGLKQYTDGISKYSGSTDAAGAFNLIKSDVKSEQKNVIIIFVTDGGFDDDRAAIDARNKVLSQKQGTEIIAIGVTGAKEKNIEAIGTISNFSKIVGDSTQLSKTFVDVAEFLKKSGRNI